jgi:hypothetical protein
MKKFVAFLASGVLALSMVGAISAPSSAASKFPSCSSLNKKFPTGVARTSSAANKVKSGLAKPAVDRATFDRNRGLDRDRDSVICPVKAGAATDAYSKKWGTFETVTYTGIGDDVIELPKALKAGFVEVAHDGEANFIVWAYDKDMEMVDLLANEIGFFTGTAGFGMGYFEEATKFLEVTADGSWTITLKPLSQAPSFPSSGEGTGVFKVNMKAGSKNISHSGEENFIMWQYCTNDHTDLIANEIGNYSGRKLVKGGTCIITVDADGSWSLK